MARRYEYFCDNCGKGFGMANHINIKTLIAAGWGCTHYESNNPRAAKWEAKAIENNQELHFCNGACVGKWFDARKPKELVFGGERPNIGTGPYPSPPATGVKEDNWES